MPIRYVMVRDVAGELRPQAFLCTDLEADPVDILRWFVRRWSIEVTFAEVRRHLGVETQRQWSDPAIARTTPALLGLFLLVTLWAHERCLGQAMPCRAAAWYAKPLPTFSDALALVRRELWTRPGLDISANGPRLVEMPQSTRAAGRMEMSQPAMSNALSRLRVLFGDPLEARRLMVSEGITARRAALAAGYESAPQFSRDYAKRFGMPTQREVQASCRAA